MKNITVEQKGNQYTIYNDGKFDGEIVKQEKGWQWRNPLARTIQSPLTQGVSSSLRTAFAQLGYKYKDGDI